MSFCVLKHEPSATHYIRYLDSSGFLRRRTEVRQVARYTRAIKRMERLKTEGLPRAPKVAPVFQLGDELSDSLRCLRPEGSLWREWQASAMRRGKVEIRKRRLNERKAKGRQERQVERFAWKQFG